LQKFAQNTFEKKFFFFKKLKSSRKCREKPETPLESSVGSLCSTEKKVLKLKKFKEKCGKNI